MMLLTLRKKRKYPSLASLSEKEKEHFSDQEGHNLLHLAVINDDLEEAKKMLSTPFVKQKNVFGLTPKDLSFFLGNRTKKELFFKELYQEHLITFQKEKKIFSLPISDFEEMLEISYTPHLQFLDVFTLYKILKICRKQTFPKDQKYLGKCFEKDLFLAKTPKLKIKWINNQMEFGLFANEDLQPKQFVSEYAGILRPFHSYQDHKNPYCFEYFIADKKPSFVIDAREWGNESRFVNHSDHPNVEPWAVYLNGLVRIVLRTNCWIRKGQELSYDYGPTYWRKREAPI